jgi:hypothetical protein
MMDRQWWIDHDRRLGLNRDAELAGDVRAIVGGAVLGLVVFGILLWSQAPWAS